MPSVANLGMAVAGPLVLKDVPQGAATELYAAIHPAAAAITGAYLADCNLATPRADADDPAPARRLWEVIEAIVARLPA
jgi:WW domain-containing oxidoreductase